MMRLRIIFAFMLLSLTCNTVKAFNDGKEIFLDIKHTINRPRMPMRYQLVCTYDNGRLEFVLPPYINRLDVVIENGSGIVWEGTVDRENLSADIPVLTSDAVISCISDGGQEFCGTIVVEDGDGL